MMKIQFIMTRTFKEIPYMKNIAGIVLFVTMFGCNNNESITTAKKEEIKADLLKVLLLSTDTAQKSVVLPAELLPNENVQLRAKVQGYIRRMNADIGTMVSKGQVLALIDAPEINTRIQELNEKVKAAESRYRSSKDYFDRINTAAKADGVIAPGELQRTKNQMITDSAEYNASLFAASSYRQTGNYLAIIAPFSGIITKRNIELGSFVGSAGEKALFELQDNATLRLRVAVPEIYTAAVLLHNTAEITVSSFPGKKFKAILARKAGSIDNETRSETWEFEIPNTGRELKPGGYADIQLRFTRTEPSAIVPPSAVVTTLERKFIIKVSASVIQWVDVRNGFNMGEKQEVFGELNAGDTIVLKGSEELKPGTKVTAVIVQLKK
jgi:RND family efflux transporter MFP subunit